MKTTASKEVLGMAHTLLAAAREYHGQDFRTDPKLWLFLAEAAIRQQGEER